MASKRTLMVIALVALALSPALAKEYIVGDEKGWTAMDPDYEAWVAGKEFRVGDKLIFKYKVGFHNVVKVDETSFQKCVAPESSELLISGNDVITLEKSGKEWFICSVGSHCELKQKLAITVLPQDGAAAPSPSGVKSASGDSPAAAKSTASGGTASGFYIVMATAFSFLVQMMV